METDLGTLRLSEGDVRLAIREVTPHDFPDERFRISSGPLVLVFDYTSSHFERGDIREGEAGTN
jgi:hypothetical protein